MRRRRVQPVPLPVVSPEDEPVFAPEPEIEDDGASDDQYADPIAIEANEARVADKTIERLRAEPNLYTRGGQLVHVVRAHRSDRALIRVENAPRIEEITRANLREMISRHAKYSRGVGGIAHPPEWLVRAIHERREWPTLRPLRGVVTAPVLRPDGTAVERDGYDASTELWVATGIRASSFTATPTHADAMRARDELLGVFCDFPFEGEPHRAACIAALLTPLARFAFDGPSPLFAITKPVRGAGGTLLADTIGVIVTGEPMPRMVAARSPDEERKRITSIALSGDSIVLIDNVAGTLGTDALDAALTGTTWSDRLLGRNATVRLPLHITWYATGNNMAYAGDTLRRVCEIVIVPDHERPEERSGFRHSDLLAWVRAERPRLISACVTILRAYCLAGRPDMRLRPWGSYEAWSALVRAAVVWVGLDDPAKTREELTTAGDTERNALADVLAAWRQRYPHGASVAEVVRDLAKKPEFVDKLKTLRDALEAWCPARGGAVSARAIGARLRRVRRRVVGGMTFDARPGKSAAGVVWLVQTVGGVSDCSDGSDSSFISRENEIVERTEDESLQSLESRRSAEVVVLGEARRRRRPKTDPARSTLASEAEVKR